MGGLPGLPGGFLPGLPSIPGLPQAPGGINLDDAVWLPHRLTARERAQQARAQREGRLLGNDD